MAVRTLFWLLCFLTLASASARAQVSNARLRWITTGAPAPADSLTIVPASIRVLIPADSSIRVVFDSHSNTVRMAEGSPADSVLITYRVLPFRLGALRYHRNPQSYDTIALFRPPANRHTGIPETREEFFATRGLQKSGSISRGVSFGNTQNVFVNSALNLQLEGQLSEDIAIRAVISDQNVPFQPEGNTQQLQEFDKVFVQLTGKQHALTVGDLVWLNPRWLNNGREPSHFLRYYKNVQGVQADLSYRISPEIRAQTSVGAAVSKGKFASVLVEVSEGVQGPYRLRGPGNERFIIVLANSEQVYLDGRLLKRGFDYDYIIDYNLAEITFTANVLITRFSRLRVDFEYSDRIYGRTALSAAHQQQSGKWRFFSNYYLEKDNPRNPLTISLTDADQLLLSQIGDSLHKARVPGVSMLEAYDRNLILYEPKDTLIGSYAYTCYVHSTDPEKARYQLHFTEVGPGKGNYVLVRSVANGRVYEWRAPLNGIPQGTYEAVRLIATPAKKQMLTLGGEFAVSEAESVFTELAFSERDANLFSPLDAADNRGTAWKAGYVNRGKKLAFLPAYEWVGGADVEYTSRYFTAIDRFRDVEYDRDWSARTDTSRADDRIINLSVGIRKSAAAISGSSGAPPAGGDRLLYRFSWRNRGEEINGWQQRVDFGKQIGRWQISADAFRMRSERSRSLSEWQRLRVQTEYRSAYLIPGYVFSLDKNQIRALGQRDSITGSAMNFEEHTFFLKSNDTLPNKFRVEYSVRADNFPLNGRLLKNTQSQTVSSGVQTRLGSHNDLAFTATYRKLENVQLSDHLRTEETLMGRLDWNGNWFADAVRSEATFTAGTGRELRREYVFLPVPAGEGTHTWRDDNNDGRQDLNEFYPAINPDERNFAKFFVPTDQYIRAYSNSLNYRLNLKAPQNWHQGGAFTAFLARFSSVSSWSIHRKLTDDHLYRRFVPFARHIPDESLVSTQELLRSAIFFNRSHPKYGLDLHLQHSGHKQLLTNGFESRQAEEVTYNSRVNLSRNLSVKGVLAQRVQTSQSDFLSGRNYRITGQSLSPELAYQPRASLRISGNYAYSVKKNALTEASDELAVAHQVGLDTRWAKVSKRTMAASLRLIQISYTGPVNTPLGYEMLDALRPGTNWTWSYNLQQRLSNGLQINVSYEGRKSETQRVIHTGRMQVTALF